MALSPISPISPIASAVTGATPAPAPVMPTAPLGVEAPSTASKPSFADVMTRAVDGLQATQQRSESLATQAATGSLTDIHDYLIASSEAALATQMTVAVRNKAVEAFNEIMRMPI
jgi:flagellar hook-basal body complex protein FliE